MAYAQAIQSAAIVIITWLILRRQMEILPIVPHRWNHSLFSELATYGLHFQLITASQALREPVTKALLTKFGGLALTGLYDMAARCVITLRELLVQSNQVLVPTISHLQERDPKSIPAIYRESYRLIFFLAVPAFTSLAVVSPFISRVWIGRYEPVFVEFVATLCAGWIVNVLANPAYVMDLGTGSLRWVSVGCISTAVLNAGLGFLYGWRFGGSAVVVAAAFSLATGYLIVLAAYHIENRVPFNCLLPKESGWNSRHQQPRRAVRTSVPPRHASTCQLFPAGHGGRRHRVNSLDYRRNVDSSHAPAATSLGHHASPCMILWESTQAEPIAARIAIAGDFLPAGNLALPLGGWGTASRGIAPYFDDVVISFMNLESALDAENLPARPPMGLGQTVSAPSASLEYLRAIRCGVLDAPTITAWIFAPPGLHALARRSLAAACSLLGQAVCFAALRTYMCGKVPATSGLDFGPPPLLRAISRRAPPRASSPRRSRAQPLQLNR